MSVNFGESLAAIVGIVGLIITIITERKSLGDFFRGLKSRGYRVKSTLELFVQLFNRLWRQLLLILFIFLFLQWLSENLRISFQTPVSSWKTTDIVFAFGLLVLAITLLFVFRKQPTKSQIERPKLERIFTDFENAAVELVEQFRIQSSVEILQRDTKWFFSFVPTIVYSRLRSKKIRILCNSPLEPKERQSIGILVRMGCEVRILKKSNRPPIEMFLFDSNIENGGRGLISLPQYSVTSRAHSTFYEKGFDEIAIKLLHNYFNQVWEESRPVRFNEKTGLSLEKINIEQIVNRLKSGVPQYSSQTVTISFEKVKLSDLWFLSRRIYEYRYKQVPNILKLYEEIHANLFDPIAIKFPSNRMTIMTPPILERLNDKLVILNGSHRAYYCRSNNTTEHIWCVVVNRVEESLPGVPVRFEHVKVEKHKVEPTERIDRFDYGRFRHVESAIHPPSEVWL